MKAYFAKLVSGAAVVVSLLAAPSFGTEKKPDRRALVPTTVDGIGRVWVPVLINGQGPFRMALDTGSDTSAVLPRIAQKLGITSAKNKNVLAYGVTGATYLPTINVASMRVGDFVLKDTQILMVKDAFDGADGILGTRGWHDARLLLDFERDVLRISPSEGEEIPFGFRKIPISLTENRLIQTDVKIAGVTVKAILDTGSERTIGNEKLLQALTRNPDGLVKQEVVGISLAVAQGKNFALPPVRFNGDVEVQKLTVTFGKMFIFDFWKLNESPAILIGMDAFAAFHSVIIDYKMGELYVRPAVN